MDQAQISQHTESRAKKKCFVSASLAAVVILLAIQPITQRWHNYDWLSKFLATFFLLTLATKPILDLRVQVKGHANGPFAIAWDGHILTFMAITLFAWH